MTNRAKVDRLAYLVPAPGIPVRGPSGASAHVRALASAWSDDIDVQVYAARRVDKRGAFGNPVPTIACGAPGWPSWLDRYRDLVEVAASRRVANRVVQAARHGWVPDVVVERHSLFSDAGWRVSDAINVPWVLEVNAPPVMERSRYETMRRPTFARRWEHKVLHQAPAVVAVSRWLKDWLETEVGCRNVHWIPNGVTPLRGNRERGRALLGMDEEARIIGFVGSMKPWHGVDSLRAIATGSEAHLALIGEGTAGPDGAIRTGHLGPQDLADVVAALDVGLAPYPEDAPPWFCPLKVLDYRAQGTPVVGTDVGETRTMVGDGGTIVKPGELDTMIDAVRYWIGRRAKRRVRSWQRVGTQMIDAAFEASQPSGAV